MKDESITKVYYIDCNPLGDGLLFEKTYSQMPEERKKKIDSYRFDKDRRLSLGAGYLALKYNYDGSICQNLSHSGNYAAIALSKYPVGLDIETVKIQDRKIADRFFHPEESEYLQDHSTDFDREFTRIWTMKESYVKMLGMGFAVDPASFSVFDEKLLRDIGGLDYSIRSSAEINGYFLSVCSCEKGVTVSEAYFR